jgi:hypothetical protein
VVQISEEAELNLTVLEEGDKKIFEEIEKKGNLCKK